MARGLGIGKIRHLDTSLLWVQDKVRSGEVKMDKVLGSENPGDIFTKIVEEPILDNMIDKLGLVVEEGRPDSAPQISNAVQLVGCLTTRRLRRGC